MLRRRFIQVAVLAFAGTLLFTGCHTGGSYLTGNEPPPPNPAAAQAAGLSSTDIAGARDLYIAKCARCHKFYNPRGYDEAEWNTWMRKMSRKARLKPDEESLLTHYFDAVRNGRPPVNGSRQ